MKKILLYLLIPVIAFAAYALYEYNRKPKPTSKIAPAYSLTSEELYNDFSVNEQSAVEKYVGKVVEVSGTIEEINTKGEQMKVVLSAADYPIGGVNCTLSERANELNVGDMITVKGHCQGMLMQVVINKAIVL